MAARIKLTPGQIVSIHGWIRPIETLSWKQVLRLDLTFAQLLALSLRPRELFTLQPDLKKWVESGRVCLADCPHLKPWGAHPIRDLKADLGDLVVMKLTPEALADMGVTYSDLKEVGLTPVNMSLFGFSLVGWHRLGMTRADAEWIPASQHLGLFQMQKQAVMAALPK